ncbi:hypothetical protein ACFFRR_003491 [Megaselia abdita]
MLINSISFKFHRRRLRTPRVDRYIYNEICQVCFQVTHNRRFCPTNTKTIACSSCYRMHFFSTNCICSNPIIDPAQSLRMCGTQICRPFMDVYILSACIPALINTSIVQTKIDHKVAEHILSLHGDIPGMIPKEMDVDFTLGSKSFHLKCNVGLFEEADVHIHLGMDFLSLQHLRIKFGDVKLYGHYRWATDHPDDVQFAYNTPYGKHLRTNLDRVGYPMLPKYSRRTLPDGKPRTYFSHFRDDSR